MCGRGGLEYSWQTIHDYMNLVGAPAAGGITMLNVAPSSRRAGEVRWTRMPVVTPGEQGRQLQSMVWPLVPNWLKGDLPKFSTANCRSESDEPFSKTVSRKPTFRNAWKQRRRCLVPFSWFYEWDQRSKPKQPWRVMPVDSPLLVMAGLWDCSPTANGETMESFTIVTTSPNRLLTDIGHHRAPVLLEADEWDLWLNGDDHAAERLIRPPADGVIEAEKVTMKVNNPEYQGEDLRPDHG